MKLAKRTELMKSVVIEGVHCVIGWDTYGGSASVWTLGEMGEPVTIGKGLGKFRKRDALAQAREKIQTALNR